MQCKHHCIRGNNDYEICLDCGKILVGWDSAMKKWLRHFVLHSSDTLLYYLQNLCSNKLWTRGNPTSVEFIMMWY